MLRFGSTVLTFVLVGPPVGFATLVVLLTLHDGGFITPVHPITWYLWAAYPVGGLPAFVAGIGVAIQERPGWWSVSRVGLIIGWILAAILALGQVRFLPGVDVKTALRGAAMLLVWPASVCLVPTIVCWLVVRGWSR